MSETSLLRTLRSIESLPKQDEQSLGDALSVLVALNQGKQRDADVMWVRRELTKVRSSESYDLIKRTYFLRGAYNFDDYMIGTEWNRAPNARFWLPRRKVLEGKHHIATKIQSFLDNPASQMFSLSTPPGAGKALTNDTMILTRNGWKRHGDLKVGDMVIGRDGKFHAVLRVFPKVMCDRRVWFSDKTYIDCHARHEWVIHNRGSHSEQIREVIDFPALDTGTPGKRGHRYTIQLVSHEPVAGEEKKLPVSPYTLGAWLGDGTNVAPNITIDGKDGAIKDAIVADGYPVRKLYIHRDFGTYRYTFDGLRPALRTIGMCVSHRNTVKHIPEEYMTASYEQRMELLAGLIDTDGSLADETKYRFSTINPTLRDNVVALVSTFGWRCCVITAEPKVSTSGIVGRSEVYIVQFCPDAYVPCRLKRKQMKRFGLQRKIAITKVEQIAPKEGNCIEVEGGTYLAGERLHVTHNSTLIKFLLSYISGRDPQLANMYVSFSDGMIKMMLDSLVSMLTDSDEYNHNSIFPNCGKPTLSAEYKTISYRKKGDFPTLGLVSLGGSVTGRTRANNFMIADDLVKNAEEARSPERLQKLWDDFNATITTRQIGDSCRMIMLGTIWSAHDPISRMRALYGDDPRYTFVAIPVWDENEVSNFEYEHPDRYTHDKIAQIRDRLDSTDFECLYMQHGVEREGLAFAYDSLRYYNGELPDGEPDNIYFYVDVAYGGGDSLSMPIAYQYGEDVYIHDVVFSKATKDKTQPRIVGKILQHKCRRGGFEANNGGDQFGNTVNTMLRDAGYHCNITSKKSSTAASKLSRIEQFVPEIKNFYFLDSYHRSTDYQKFMREVTGFSFTTKNLHDDAPDSLAGLCDLIYHGTRYASVGVRIF